MLGGLLLFLVPVLLLGLVWLFVWLTARGQRRAEALAQAGSGGAAPAAADLLGQAAPASPPAACVEQPVEFQTFAGQFDPVRRGKGTARVAEGTLVIVGRRRRLFALRRDEERIALQAVYDVAVDDRLVRFRVEGQAARLPRLLRLTTPQAAARFAACLPQRLSAAGAQAKADAQAFARFLEESGVPAVTLAVIAANLAVFVLAGLKGAGWLQGDARVLYDLGGNFAAATALGQWWRLGSSMFLHAGLMHVAFNMWALWDAGRIAERLFGRGRFALVYLAAGLAGGIASINWQQDVVGVGASGAIFGVYGALLAALTLRQDLLPLTVAKQLSGSTTVFMAYSLFNGFTHAGIDNAAHIGGLAVGALLGAGLAASAPRLWASLAAALALLGVGAARATERAEPVRDEVAFRAFLVSFAPEEARLNAAAKALFGSVKGMPPAEVVRRLDAEVVAGWREQDRRIAALTRLTSRSREIREPMAQFIHLKAESLQDLRDGIERDDEQLVLAAKAKLERANQVMAEAKRRADERKGGKAGGR